MTSLINRSTFIQTGTETVTYQSKRGPYTSTFDVGTVEVTLRGITKTLKARRYERGDIYVNDVTGRYVQGGKAWPAVIRSEEGKSDYINFGRDDRSGRFNKANGLFFSKEA